MRRTIALFGEAEKGHWDIPHIVKELPALMDRLGHPPEHSEGLFFAIQALLYERNILYFRVQDEGFSKEDYLNGLNLLKTKNPKLEVHALCMPGVGDPEILSASGAICEMHKTHLIVSEKDLFDYLTGI